jgi:hypothetical protein
MAFGKKQNFLANFDQILASILLEKLSGEFFAKRRSPATFRSVKKFDEIEPRMRKC